MEYTPSSIGTCLALTSIAQNKKVYGDKNLRRCEGLPFFLRAFLLILLCQDQGGNNPLDRPQHIVVLRESLTTHSVHLSITMEYTSSFIGACLALTTTAQN